MNRPRLVACLAVCLAACVTHSPAARAAAYRVTPIAPVGEMTFEAPAASVNDHGVVVGYTGTDTELGVEMVPFLFEHHSASALPNGGLSGTALAVSDENVVVGYELTSTEGDPGAVAWVDRRDTGLPGLGGVSEALAVNDAGTIVGESGTETDVYGEHAAVWSSPGGPASALPEPAGVDRSNADAINDRGAIVGAVSWGPRSRAVIWRERRPSLLPGGWASGAVDINDRGEVLGWISGRELTDVPVLWIRGRLHRLGARDRRCCAKALNDRGIAVGSIVSPGAQTGFGAVWAHGSVASVDSLLAPRTPWRVTDAADINSHGAIAATAERAGRLWAVRLTPVPPGVQLDGLQAAVRALHRPATAAPLLRLLGRARRRIANGWPAGACWSLRAFTEAAGSALPAGTARPLLIGARDVRYSIGCRG